MSEKPNAKELLLRGCGELKINVRTEDAEAMLQHMALLLKWNQTHNLTAITDERDMVIRHLLDALSIAPWVLGRTVLDIGSGGGLPGLPLAIVHRHRTFTLLDSRGKRAEFLRFASSRLGLRNVTVRRARVEALTNAGFDCLLVRAVCTLQLLFTMIRELQAPGTRVLAQKGAYPAAELAALTLAQREHCRVEKIRVPFYEGERHLVVIDF